ncbi:MAG: APA family basic amino acid/polyamine antiporter [Limisphaerales bacterium]|jgi:APA family basic amino acid/polyamine antiporter
MSDGTRDKESGLKPALGFWSLVAVAIGSCIGSGIFRTPSEIAIALPHEGWILAVWTLGGLVAMAGALTFSELGGMFPGSGGVYRYLREAYGDLIAFLYGWCILTMITSGAIAALGVTFADFLARLYPLGESGKLIAAACSIILLSLINVFGVKWGAAVARYITGAKLIGIAAIVVAGLTVIGGDNSWSPGSSSALQNGLGSGGLASGIAAALVGVFWSFGGWHHTSYLAGETTNPSKTIPRAMIIGVAVVSVSYLLTNLAYMLLLPIDEIANSPVAAANAVEKVVPWGGRAIAAMVTVSVFGTIAIYTMSAPRVYYRMAADGNFFKSLAKIHPKYGTPANAILAQMIWALVLLLFFKQFVTLITYVVFTDIIFMGLAAYGLIILRRKRPDAVRPIKVWGYPVIPLFFCGVLLWFNYQVIYNNPIQIAYGLGLILLGIPLYYFLFRTNKS